VRVEHAKIEQFTYRKKYHAIFCLNVLHFLKKRQMTHVISSMKTNTVRNGINVITVFTENDPAAKRNRGTLTYFTTGELKEYYNDWTIAHYKEYMTPREIHKGNPHWHRHHIAELIAIK
jgi:hypothetical protein